MTCDTNEKVHLTVMLPAGRLPLDIMAKAHSLATQHNLDIYLSNAQNIRLLNIPAGTMDDVKASLAALGATFKKKGAFPIPRACIGMPHCNHGIIDTHELSDKILAKFASRPHTKPKFKVAIAACGTSCSNPKVTDIGIIAKQKGFDFYLGGKGGVNPQVGIRVMRNCSEDDVLNAIDTLVEYHDVNTDKKHRMIKLMDRDDFPFKEEV